jgi:hypothetical protein
MFGVGVGVRVGGQRFGSGVAPYVGLLDTYPGAAAAYSLRLLKSDYTGNAIRVRRTDLSEQNIGFDANGNLDTTALLSFVGTGVLDNGFITTWYDQSGNSVNLIQTTALNQPQIVSSGSVLLVNTKPCIRFDGIDDKLTQALLFNSVSTQFFVYDKIGSTGYLGGLFLGSSESPGFLFDSNGVFPYQQGPQFGPTYSNNSQALMSFKSSTTGTNWELYGNSNAVVGVENIGNLINVNTVSLGGRGTSSNFGNFDSQEYIVYSSNQMSNRTGIETNINSYYAIY